MNSSTCETIQLRLFDDDCRHGAPLPDDVASHLQCCETCRQHWQTDQHLRAQLLVTPAPKIYRRAYIAAVADNAMRATYWENGRRFITAFLLAIAMTLAALWMAIPVTYQWLLWTIFPVVFAVILLCSWFYDWQTD